jgi:hypothetical protein
MITAWQGTASHAVGWQMLSAAVSKRSRRSRDPAGIPHLSLQDLPAAQEHPGLASGRQEG